MWCAVLLILSAAISSGSKVTLNGTYVEEAYAQQCCGQSDCSVELETGVFPSKAEDDFLVIPHSCDFRAYDNKLNFSCPANTTYVQAQGAVRRADGDGQITCSCSESEHAGDQPSCLPYMIWNSLLGKTVGCEVWEGCSKCMGTRSLLSNDPEMIFFKGAQYNNRLSWTPSLYPLQRLDDWDSLPFAHNVTRILQVFDVTSALCTSELIVYVPFSTGTHKFIAGMPSDCVNDDMFYIGANGNPTPTCSGCQDYEWPDGKTGCQLEQVVSSSGSYTTIAFSCIAHCQLKHGCTMSW